MTTNIYQLKQVIDRLNTRIPLTEEDDKFKKMIFLKEDGFSREEYDALTKIVMEAVVEYVQIFPLLEKLKPDDGCLIGDLVIQETIEKILEIVSKDEEKETQAPAQ